MFDKTKKKLKFWKKKKERNDAHHVKWLVKETSKKQIHRKGIRKKENRPEAQTTYWGFAKDSFFHLKKKEILKIRVSQFQKQNSSKDFVSLLKKFVFIKNYFLFKDIV